MEQHAPTQREFDAPVVDAAPFGGQLRHHLAAPLVVASDQRLEDAGKDALADIALLAQRVERVRVDDLLHGDRDDRPVVGLRGAAA